MEDLLYYSSFIIRLKMKRNKLINIIIINYKFIFYTIEINIYLKNYKY